MTVATASITTAGNVAYSSNGNSAVTYLTLCNYSAGDVTANVYIVPFGGSPGNTNIIIAIAFFISFS